MALTTQPARHEYTATSGQTIFPYLFRVFAASDLYITVNGGAAPAFSVTGVLDEAGGTIVFASGLTAGDKVIITSNIPYEQPVTYEEGDTFPAASHELGLDRLGRLCQQIKEITDRCLQVNVAQSFGLSALELPAPSSLTLTNPANRRAFIWNSLGTNLALTELSTETGLITSAVTGVAKASLPSGVDVGTLRSVLDADRGLYHYGAASQWTRVSPMINPRDFGAKGDDTTDDTAAIQAALTQGAAEGYPVFIDAGTYRLDGALTFVTGQAIWGMSPNRTILKSYHTGTVLAPADLSTRYEWLDFRNFKITNTTTTPGSRTGIGLRLSHSRHGFFQNLHIEQMETALLFKPHTNDNYSYFNLFQNLRIFNNDDVGLRATVETGTTDYPNANLIYGGQFRASGGATPECLPIWLEYGSTWLLHGIDVEGVVGPNADWLKIGDTGNDNPTGVKIVDCRFEANSANELAPGRGIVFHASKGTVRGGSLSKGGFAPYVDANTGQPDTVFDNVRFNGDYININVDHLSQLGVSVRGVSWAQAMNTGAVQEDCGIGFRQNLVTESVNPSQAVWDKSGSVTFTTQTSNGPNGFRGVKVDFGTAAGTTPNFGQTFDGASGKADVDVAGKTFWILVETRADSYGENRLRVSGSTGGTTESRDYKLKSTAEIGYRASWFRVVFTGAATGKFMFSIANVNDSQQLDTIYLGNVQVLEAPSVQWTPPALRVTTGNNPVTTATYRADFGTMPVLAQQGAFVAFDKAGAIVDGDFTEVFNGMLCGTDSSNGRLYFRHGGAMHYVTQTAGFQINAEDAFCHLCGENPNGTPKRPFEAGDLVLGVVNGFGTDGAPHCEYVALDEALRQLGVQVPPQPQRRIPERTWQPRYTDHQGNPLPPVPLDPNTLKPDLDQIPNTHPIKKKGQR